MAASDASDQNDREKNLDRVKKVREEEEEIQQRHPGIQRPFGSLSEEYVAADRDAEDPLKRK